MTDRPGFRFALQPCELRSIPLCVETVRVKGASLVGARAELVTVEAHFEGRDRAQTEVVLTGLPDPVLRESRGRLLCALHSNHLGLGSGRLFLNLVPAGRPKSGVILDLPLVLAAAGAGGHLPRHCLEGTLFLGEVGIDGTLHAVAGGLAASLAAVEHGIARVIAPVATAREAACVPGLDVRGAQHLAQVIGHVTRSEPLLARAATPPDLPPASGAATGLDDVRGQAAGKHALVVAAAGGHGLLYVGPPGVGKSMLARQLVELLPPPALAERLEITSALSAAGRWPGGVASARPFRAPHHTTSYAGLVGGGIELAPGEITLAHRGVLFLDELPEFRREALECLRQPLETGAVLIGRAGRQVEFPARFQLVCAMNPCACGYLGHPRLPCTCSAKQVRRYRQRISGPLLDRIELRVELSPPDLDALTARADPASGPSQAELIRRVEEARRHQQEREPGTRNADLSSEQLDRWAPLSDASRALLSRACERRALSARALQSLRRVARTLADLERAQRVESAHIAQALALRAPLI